MAWSRKLNHGEKGVEVWTSKHIMKTCLIILTLALTLANSPTLAQNADADRPADEPTAYLGVAPDLGADIRGVRIDGIPMSPSQIGRAHV